MKKQYKKVFLATLAIAAASPEALADLIQDRYDGAVGTGARRLADTFQDQDLKDSFMESPTATRRMVKEPVTVVNKKVMREEQQAPKSKLSVFVERAKASAEKISASFVYFVSKLLSALSW